MPLPVGLAVRAEETFPLEAGLLDGADRGDVVDGGLCKDAVEAKIAQPPLRSQPYRSRGDPAPTSLGEHRDGDPGHLPVLVELQVEETKWAVVGGVGDHEWRAATRAPLFLGPREAFALTLRRERLVIEPTQRLRVVRRLRDRPDVLESPVSKNDLAVGERRIGRSQSLPGQAPDATAGAAGGGDTG